jgi:ABC-type polysaccharide/polyol phosphate transport system ATPase subunit
VRLRGVSRSFRVHHERNATLKETILRRRRGQYTDRWALRAVDLDIRPGESVGIVGQNGSGKSTLLKLVAGILRPQAGTVESVGSVASMLELGAGFHPDFTGRENVYLNGAILGMSERQIDERFEQILGFSELQEYIDMPVKTYSSGMQMRLAFSVASHVDADILLLDEVLTVGDEAFQRKCMGRIFEFRRRGGTLLFVSHDSTIIERVCGRVLLLWDGDVIADGLPSSVLATYHRLLANDSSHTVEPAATSEVGDPRVWGSREVLIEEIRLLSPDGPADRFISGQTLAIEVRVYAPDPVATPVFGIAIHSVDGSLMYGTNTKLDEFTVDRVQGRLTARFEIPHLALHEGRFAVTAAIHSADESVVLHWLDKMVEFTVFQRSNGLGPVDLSGTWTINDPTVQRTERPDPFSVRT